MPSSFHTFPPPFTAAWQRPARPARSPSRRAVAGAWSHIVALTTAIVATTSIGAAPAPLSLTQAQQLAIARSPQIGAYDGAIAATRELARSPAPSGAAGAIGVAPLAVEDADALSFGRDANPVRRMAVATGAATPEQRAALMERYAREADRAVAEKTAASVDIAREAALAWIDAYYADQVARVAAQELKAAQAELDGAESTYWGGRSSQADFYGARSTLVMIEDKSSVVEHRVRAARIALKRWVGDPADSALAAPPNFDRIRLRSAALEGDLARHPDVALLDRQEGLAASDVRLAQANGQPQREIALLLARRGEAHAARDEKLRAKVAEVGIMIDEWLQARDRRTRYATELVPLARERTVATLVAYRGGKAGLTEVFAARRAESDAQMQSIDMQRDAARLWARLEFTLPDALPAAAGESARSEGAP